MIIYLAGNTPEREREEIVLLSKGLMKNKLLSYYYLKTDPIIYKMLKLYKK